MYMSKIEKLLKRFRIKPKDFKYSELKTLLSNFGYKEIKKGKTSGSRVSFYNENSSNLISLHKPHPKEILKRYQLDLIEEELLKQGVIK